ncbi:MAG: hypothetical protein KC506_00840 [Nanoarchaeota archaeon]|nr:hypothetical protein [Nanoarchaeota archaeon]
MKSEEIQNIIEAEERKYEIRNVLMKIAGAVTNPDVLRHDLDGGILRKFWLPEFLDFYGVDRRVVPEEEKVISPYHVLPYMERSLGNYLEGDNLNNFVRNWVVHRETGLVISSSLAERNRFDFRPYLPRMKQLYVETICWTPGDIDLKKIDSRRPETY